MIFRIFFPLLSVLPLTSTWSLEPQDRNADGEVIVLAFGDSLTVGVGSSFSPDQFVDSVLGEPVVTSYPQVLSQLLTVQVVNSGVSGEVFTENGVSRFVEEVREIRADMVLFLEGANDAFFRVAASDYQEKLQKLVNAMAVLEVDIVLLTQIVPCCDRGSLSPFTREFSRRVRTVAALNGVAVVDIEREWDSVCPVASICSLLNRPEGLHPNQAGYTFIAEQVAFALGFEREESSNSLPPLEGENDEG